MKAARARELPISVVMSVHNGSPFLAKAMDSILSQTFTDYEFVVINDGSTDGSGEIIKSYGDPRIRYFEQERIGLAASLNRAIRLARGRFLARMDADDIALPSRLEEQVAFLERSPDCACLGAYCYLIDENGKRKSLIAHPHHDVGIRWLNLFDSPFVHSSVVFRREAIENIGLYNTAAGLHVEDYDLWSRLLSRYRAANIPRPLMLYRDNPRGISHTWRAEQEQNSIDISARNIAVLLDDDSFGAENARRIRYLRTGRWPAPTVSAIEASASDLRRVAATFASSFRSQLEAHPSAKARINTDQSWALLAAAYLSGQCGDRGLAIRMASLGLRRRPASAFNPRFVKAVAVLTFGSRLPSVARSWLHRLR